SLWLLFFECLHFNAWVLAIALTLKAGTHNQVMPRSLKILFGSGWTLTAIMLFAAILDYEQFLYFSAWFPLMLAVIALVSVEQLFRYVAANDRQIKLLCMNLTALFLYDIYLYTHTLIF